MEGRVLGAKEQKPNAVMVIQTRIKTERAGKQTSNETKSEGTKAPKKVSGQAKALRKRKRRANNARAKGRKANMHQGICARRKEKALAGVSAKKTCPGSLEAGLDGQGGTWSGTGVPKRGHDLTQTGVDCMGRRRRDGTRVAAHGKGARGGIGTQRGRQEGTHGDVDTWGGGAGAADAGRDRTAGKTSVDTSEGRIRTRGEEKNEEREEKDEEREGGDTPISRSQGSTSKVPYKHGTRDLEAQPELQVAPSTRCVFASAQNRCGWGARTKLPASSARDAAARQQSEAVMRTTEEARIGCVRAETRTLRIAESSQRRGGTGRAWRHGRGRERRGGRSGHRSRGTVGGGGAGTQGRGGTRRVGRAETGKGRGNGCGNSGRAEGTSRVSRGELQQRRMTGRACRDGDVGEDKVARRDGHERELGASVPVLGSVGEGRGGRVRGGRGGRAAAAAGAQKGRQRGSGVETGTALVGVADKKADGAQPLDPRRSGS
ncbi:hypothetical protein B0H14DRAFT_2618827 [Mycena olivaceomarginata]|nr:hypothetical protein B0H14DRAFT_2618827 [Mycena olivaceomarginata]